MGGETKENNHEISRGHTEKSRAAGNRENEDIHFERMTKKQLIEKIKEVQQKAEKNLDLYVRSQADTENLKKRFQKEKEELIKFSNESLIRQLLPVVDSLEKAIAHSRNDNPVDTLAEGVELTLKGLLDALGKAGLEEVKAVGESFDPNFHEAVSQMESDIVESGTVLEELQKGYLLKKRLLRPAMVVVSKGSRRASEDTARA